MGSNRKYLDTYQRLRKNHGVTVTSKDRSLTWLWKFIHWFLYIVTFGKQDQFLNSYTTTLGRTIYYPYGWRIEDTTDESCITLAHEADHIKLNYQCGFGNIYLGTVIMGLLYLLFPLPIGFAWFRYYAERRAYKISYATAKKYGLKTDISWYIQQLTGPSYLWTWVLKKQVREWFEKNCTP